MGNTSSMIAWGIRQWVWSNWLTLRHALNRPQKIDIPASNQRKIQSVTLKSKHGDKLPLDIFVYDKLPADENKLSVRFVRFVTLTLNSIYPAMQAGLPEIDADINAALEKTLTAKYRRGFREPKLPSIFDGETKPDLEDLAVRSPYSVLLERDAAGVIKFDFDALGDFEHHNELVNLGVQVIFEEDVDSQNLHATEIRSREYGTVRKGDETWQKARLLAMCAATTHTALTRHFNYVHLVCGAQWDIATRNELPVDHPLYRLLWPSNYDSLYTNHGVTEVQLLPKGDFANVFSFTHAGLMEYFNVFHRRYSAAVMDPVADWKRRGLARTSFKCPSQENLEQLFNLMHEHAKRYVYAYYDSDEALQADVDVTRWLAALERLVANGLGDFLHDGVVNRENLSRLIGAVIYEGNTTHDLVGTTLWDYQLWVDRNPVRINRDGKRITLDVLHRLIINNFALQLRRAPLLADYGKVALDEKGRNLFTQFFQECKDLQDRYDQEPADLWRMEPKNLEISMNG